MSFISAEQAEAIRNEYAKGATQKSLGLKYGTRQTNISRIVMGQTHKKAGGPLFTIGRAEGERHGLVKLTTAQVQDLRLYRELGYTYAELSEKFGISRCQCRAIAIGQARKNG
jgi:predicted DNA-binding protein (UPF0251 family)